MALQDDTARGVPFKVLFHFPRYLPLGPFSFSFCDISISSVSSFHSLSIFAFFLVPLLLLLCWSLNVALCLAFWSLLKISFLAKDVIKRANQGHVSFDSSR
jgi:hypothetical protein